MSSLFINYILCDQEKNPTAAVALNKKGKCYNSINRDTRQAKKSYTIIHFNKILSHQKEI